MSAFLQAEMASVVFKPRPSPRSLARAAAVRRAGLIAHDLHCCRRICVRRPSWSPFTATYQPLRTARPSPLLPPPCQRQAQAEHEAARQREIRKIKYGPGPKILRISGIQCENLPDADKGMGGGTSDPFVVVELTTDQGDREEVRTQTIMNAPRSVRFPDVLELPLPDKLMRGKCIGTLVVRVWDDDSVADGMEGVNANDLMGQNAYKLNCRLTPHKLEGHIDRATYAGMGGLYAFRVSFRYEAVPVAKLPESWA